MASNITFSELNLKMQNKQNTIDSKTNLSCGTINTKGITKINGIILMFNYIFSIRELEYYDTIYINIGETTTNEAISINSGGGNFGVNGSTSSYPLHVFGSVADIAGRNAKFYTTSGSSSIAYTSDVTALIEGSILASRHFFLSDRRIKTNIQDIIDDNALQLIMKIEPKTYEYIDKIQKGDKKVYGFIAQQVKEVIPEAVSLEPLIVPNIYKIGTLSHSNLITVDTDISEIIGIGSNISLITSNLAQKEYTVSEVPQSNQFKITTNIENSNIFVYGTKVNDFHTLNKDYIFTLNVCATQELYKLIQSNKININTLQEEYKNMSNNINLIKNKINTIK